MSWDQALHFDVLTTTNPVVPDPEPPANAARPSTKTNSLAAGVWLDPACGLSLIR